MPTKRRVGTDSNVAVKEPPRHRLPLPRERLADLPFVYCPDDGRLIAPWPRGPLHFLDETRLLAALARVDALKPAGVVWLWPEPNRAPVPIACDDERRWLARWGEDRASYVARR